MGICVVTRRQGESIEIINGNDVIEIIAIEGKNNRITVGIKAPLVYKIHYQKGDAIQPKIDKQLDLFGA